MQSSNATTAHTKGWKDVVVSFCHTARLNLALFLGSDARFLWEFFSLHILGFFLAFK